MADDRMVLMRVVDTEFVPSLHSRIDTSLRPDGFEGQFRAVLKAMLNADPDNREAARRALRHAVFTGEEATTRVQEK
eukprot:3812-Eustigmatos_ZCMA.PRE.1